MDGSSLLLLAPMRRSVWLAGEKDLLGGPARRNQAMPRPDSSVVERGPEKAGVGGSIPSLATIFSIT